MFGREQTKRGMKQDRRLLSKQAHEIAYAKRLARRWRLGMKGKKSTEKAQVQVSSLKRLCDYVLKH